MLLTVEVPLPGAEYTIHVGPGALERVGALVPPPSPGRAAAVIGDGTTGELFGATVRDALVEAGWRPTLTAVAPGEDSKCLAKAEELYGVLADGGLDRSSTVFALGGGVVGDLAGFVAATYMRGIAFVTLPTSLLAQVDSSVGGKVAVDLPQGKNLVGAFHQPAAVVVDTAALGSLPPRQLSAGWAEVIKHAAIADAGLFAELEARADCLLELEVEDLTEIVARNCRIKAAVVADDPQELTGRRAILNFGHTLGHAVERGAATWGLLHGEAVAVGMVGEARVAARLGLAPPEVAERIGHLVGAAGLPVTVDGDNIDLELALRALWADKKVRAGRLTLPVVSQVGQVYVRDDVGIEDLAVELRGTVA